MRFLSFSCGILIFLTGTAIPLPGLDNNLPFSDHMLRHTALILLAAPLIAMAIPSANRLRPQLTNLSRLTARLPLLAWLAGIGMMWISHIPALYNSPVGSDTAIISCAPISNADFHSASMAAVALIPHIALFHDLALLLAGFIFCWPVITPYPSFRLPPLNAILYLASACVACSLLGLFITFAPRGMYRGISTTDQQIGGLIMWIPCCFLYLSASMVLLIRWLSLKDRRKEPAFLIH
jgi:putative membrane protein